MPGPCHRSRYMEMPIYAMGLEIPTRTSPDPAHPPNNHQMEILGRTLELVPLQHLRILAAPGHVQVSLPACSPLRGGGNGAFLGERWVRLSSASMGAPHNATFNATLLHEFGHLVDHEYGAMTSLQTRDREAYRLLAGTAHEGDTAGPGEGFADCYMIFLITRVGRLGYYHPADPSAYRGEEATHRFRALLRTRAFDGVGVGSSAP